MVWNLDPTSPADDDVVSQYPPNERSERLNTAGALGTEHDIASGHHQIPYLTTAARDGITDWVQGSIIYNTTTLQAEYQENASAPFSWIAYGAAPLSTPAISFLKLSNNAIDPNKDIDLAIGMCWDETLTEQMDQTTVPLVKQMDLTWAVGTNQGGLDAGVLAAATLYAVWLIKRTDTGVVDMLASLSFTSPTMPANYDTKRLIGAFKTADGAANILGFEQNGDYFRYTGDIPVDVDTNGDPARTFQLATLSAPPNSKADFYAWAFNSNQSNEGVFVKTNGAGDAAIDKESIIMQNSGGAGSVTVAGFGSCLVDDSSQIQYAIIRQGSNTDVSLRTIGFMMFSRSNP